MTKDSYQIFNMLLNSAIDNNIPFKVEFNPNSGMDIWVTYDTTTILIPGVRSIDDYMARFMSYHEYQKSIKGTLTNLTKVAGIVNNE